MSPSPLPYSKILKAPFAGQGAFVFQIHSILFDVFRILNESHPGYFVHFRSNQQVLLFIGLMS